MLSQRTSLSPTMALIFWCSDWFERKIVIRTVRIPWEPVVWSKDRLNQLENSQNHRTRAIDFWYTIIIEGYIMEIILEGFVSFNKDEMKCF